MKRIFRSLVAIGLLTASAPAHAGSLDGKAIYCMEKSLTAPEALGFEFLGDTVRSYKITGYSIIEEYAANYSEIGAKEVFWRGLQNTRVSLNRATLELRIAQTELYKCEVSSIEKIKIKLHAIIDAAKEKNRI